MDLLSVLDELDDEETAMLFRAIRAYNQLDNENKPEIDTSKKIGRNDPCPCGSGKKYKKCCGANL